uniref:C2H2-type domain-containing protein n=1 Tax=Globodera rostochiensis TaxID=31243 RepID=A0A914HZ61_GLORO
MYPQISKHTNKRARIDMSPQSGTHIPSNDHIGVMSRFCNSYIEASNKRVQSGFGVIKEEFTGQFQNDVYKRLGPRPKLPPHPHPIYRAVPERAACSKVMRSAPLPFRVFLLNYTPYSSTPLLFYQSYQLTRCTFQSCNKRLKNNVMFIYHIWAHVAKQKPAENEEQFSNLQNPLAEHNRAEEEAKTDDQRTDVSRLHTCPECLLEQPTPYRARLHYHRVHKRGKRLLLDSKPELHVCNICEQVIDTKNMQHHIVAHELPNKRKLDLPYGCRVGGGKCQFRTSNRGVLLQHFCNKHVGTHVVLCPFCLMTFCVPPTHKLDSMIRMRDFVRHMIMHDEEKSRHCGHCVIKVAISQRAQMDQHQEQHTKNGEHKWLQWHMEHLDLNSIRPGSSHALISSDMISQQCVECGQMVNNLCRHLGIKTKRCKFCSFVTRCARAMDRHRLLSQCNPSNAMRRPFAAVAGWTFSVDNISCSTFSPSSSLSSPPLQQFSCAQCAFCSVSVQALAEHIAAVHATCLSAQVLLLDKNNGRQQVLEEQMMLNRMDEDGQGGDKMEQDSKEVGKDELHEAELFGLLRLANVPIDDDGHDDDEDNNEDKQQRFSADKQAELRDWLSEFLPLARADELSQREIQPQDVRLLKQLMKMNRSDLSPDEERAQRIAEEKHEFRVKMCLMHDDFPKLDLKTISE